VKDDVNAEKIKNFNENVSYFLGRGDRYDPGHRIGPDGSQITIHDTPPLAYYQQGPPGNGSRSAHSAGTSGHQRKIPEVITISDSDDETSPSNSAKLQHHTHVQAAQAAAAAAAAVGQLPVYSSTSGTQDSKVVTSTAGNKTPAITTTSSARTLKVPMSSSNVNTNPSSGCPSVMALTPSNIKSQAPSVSGETPGTGSGFVSTQSTPCASRSHATSCVTVGDSDEDTSLQNSPLKTEPGLLGPGSSSSQTSGGILGPGTSGSGGPSSDPRDRVGVTTPARELNKKTRLLKAQSEWMLSSLKEEGSPAALGGPLGSLPVGASAVFGAGAPSRGGPSSSYGSYSRLSVVDEKELMHRYSTSSTLR
jgi:hypothetical protein